MPSKTRLTSVPVCPWPCQLHFQGSSLGYPQLPAPIHYLRIKKIGMQSFSRRGHFSPSSFSASMVCRLTAHPWCSKSGQGMGPHCYFRSKLYNPSHLPEVKSTPRSPPPSTKWAACRGMDTGKSRALKGKGDHTSCSGRAEERVYTNSYPWLYMGNSGTKLLEFESWPFHFLVVWPRASHLSSLAK